MNKERYIKKVKLKLHTISSLDNPSSDVNIREAVIQYYENTVEPDMVITSDEFLAICKEVGII